MMKIGILSRCAKSYSTSRLREAAEKRGHNIMVINPLKCYMNLNEDHSDVYYKPLKEQIQLNFDMVIPRIGTSATGYGTAVLRQFEVSGAYVVNGSVAITRSRDKLRAHQLLARKGVGIPITSYAHSGNVTNELIDSVGGAPLIVKITESTQGKGVLLAETTKAAESLINAFIDLHADFLIQEFIKESSGTDIRCFVVGDQVVAAMSRKGPVGDFRSNLHNGGSAEMVKITDEERTMAVKASKVLGLKVSGVDLVRSRKGPLILEVNSSPGLEGIENTTNVDVADSIIEFMEEDIKQLEESQAFFKG